MEFVRVVSLEPHAATGEAASPDALREEWRSRWTHVRSLQRQAQDPLGHLKTTVKATLDQAEKEAEALRLAARGEADRIRAEAEAAADRLTASAKQRAAELLEHAREQAEGLQGDHETTVPARVVSTGLLRLRRSVSGRAAVAAAVALAVSASVVGVVLLYGQGDGPCRSASSAARSSAVPAAYVGFQRVGVAARDEAGRVPDGFPSTTGWHLATESSASPSTSDSASASSPASAGSSASASPRHPTGHPSARDTSSAQGCR